MCVLSIYELSFIYSCCIYLFDELTISYPLCIAFIFMYIRIYNSVQFYLIFACSFFSLLIFLHLSI